MIRLAESMAKMRLSETVEKRDVDEAVRLIKTAMQQSATDPTTGLVDMDIIATGVSSTSVEKIKQIAQIIKKVNVRDLEKFASITFLHYRLIIRIRYRRPVSST